ncbi:hypothetical protein [Actinomadura sp. WMMA1423]|nr:hypothetical protein [Actinomadura sp. WMMA1423]
MSKIVSFGAGGGARRRPVAGVVTRDHRITAVMRDPAAPRRPDGA